MICTVPRSLVLASLLTVAGGAIGAQAQPSPDAGELPQCSNGLDDDGDGDVDQDDSGCFDAWDHLELAECSDGIDNDGDGQIDFGEDFQCFLPATDCELRRLLRVW